MSWPVVPTTLSNEKQALILWWLAVMIEQKRRSDRERAA